MVRLHIFVFGNVQGVGFRYYAQMKAVQYEIKGWVRNSSDGSVEMVAVGDEENMDQFLDDLRNGNAFAKVNDMKIEKLDETEPFQSFKIRY